jgi:hypothetical protein
LVERAKLCVLMTDIWAEPFAIVGSRKGKRMAFISLGEALDRVLEKLAVERGNEKAGGIDAPRKVAPADLGGDRARGVHGSTANAKARKPQKSTANRAVMR